MKNKKPKMRKKYFTKAEIILWSSSVTLIPVFFIWFNNAAHLDLAASIIGVTSLIYNAKGNPIGQLLMIVFSVLYGIISYSFAYYGEMITYLGMTAPMAAFSMITWLKNPYRGNKSEVKISNLKKNDIIVIIISAIGVTAVFYFVLKAFNTANLILSDLSVATSYIAVYLTLKRSPFYALGYAANDIVLINDIYGYLNWSKIKNVSKKAKLNVYIHPILQRTIKYIIIIFLKEVGQKTEFYFEKNCGLCTYFNNVYPDNFVLCREDERRGNMRLCVCAENGEQRLRGSIRFNVFFFVRRSV